MTEPKETEWNYKGNTVVLNALKQPDVLGLLIKMIQSQIAWPARFSPVPMWFKTVTPQKMKGAEGFENVAWTDMARIEAALKDWNISGMIPLLDKCTDDLDLMKHLSKDLYMLLRFAVLSMPLDLTPIVMKLKSTTIKMYAVKHSKEREAKFTRVGQKPTYLYHGSPMSNWHSITHNGIKVMSGTSLMTTGAVHGDGIYLSSSLNMSYSYCSASGPFMIGVYEVYDAKKYSKSIPEIHVVPSEDLLLLRYLLWVSGSTTVTELGNAMSQTLDSKAEMKSMSTAAQSKKAIKAILLRMEQLGEEYKIRSDDFTYVVDTPTGDSVTLEFTSNFQFDEPTIYLGGKQQCKLPMWKPQWSIKGILETLAYRDKS